MRGTSKINGYIGMVYLALMIVGFSLVQFLVALTNLVFLQKISNNDGFNGLISVLIPARNEEKNIGNLLSDIMNQDYQHIEVFVFNDNSSDKTQEIVMDYSRHNQIIQLINSDYLPNGWLGKNHACHSLAQKAKGEYLLFLDADVRVKKDMIIRSVTIMRKNNLGLLSIFPKQQMKSFGEYITVPNMNFILLSLLPLILVQKSKYPSISAANGQFMLFESKTYARTTPHYRFRNCKVEDIGIARNYKQENIQVACMVGDNNIQCRMYSSFKNAVDGFSKNVIAFFGNSFVLAILFWFITTCGFIIVLISLSFQLFCFYLLIIAGTRIIISLVSKQSVWLNLILAVPQQLTMGLFIYKSLMNNIKGQFEWKGRNISLL